MLPRELQSLSDHLFWDVDPDQIDVEAHAAFLIARIMDRGAMKDVRWAWEHYGAARIQEVLTTAPVLHKKTISFFALQFGIPRENFRAFRRKTARWEQ